METARSAFHAQLAAVMDSLLAAAVCEIAKIFESSLCEHQAELTLKAEEISALRCKLEKVERRPKIKAGWREEKEVSSGEREGNFRQQTPTTSDPEERLSQSLSKLKKEEVDLDRAALKRECVVLESKMGSVTVQAPDEDHTLIDVLPATQPKNKHSDWDQSSCKTDHMPPQDQASLPFLSISDSGCCSPRPDLSVTPPKEWVPGQSATSNGVSVQENLLAGGIGCSALTSTAATAPSSFQSGYQSEDNSKDDDNKFNFLDQHSENQNSGQSAVQNNAGQREDNPQVPSCESPWQNREDGVTSAPYSRSWRITSSGSRDSLQSHTLAVRTTNNLGHLPAQSEGNARPYTCPYCTKCFAYPSHQRRHLLRHTGVRLHPCQFCDKSFLTPSELTVHTRTHTGERPFACAQCGKRFARSGNLRAHQRDVHMGKRPFACEECGKRFAHRGNLRVHNHRVHQGDPYYVDEQPESEMGSSPI
ncbi:Zinc finger and SCAN domain-containing protein 5B [Oryzias melastigma]|uniref:Zinc finger and SCAN domain-containing protein 5B n=1 Tax=Oryzias melastigma TaxID=30732 RepID=A0A834F9W9_ORYME|nr:zinc finger and SCAN domain-containing protein 22 isoform X2 [Oryzias melastigma]KAF6726711.1 Zinc finger and SCAN domain-containing protein 5B [Oryzias melastigma]